MLSAKVIAIVGVATVGTAGGAAWVMHGADDAAGTGPAHGHGHGHGHGLGLAAVQEQAEPPDHVPDPAIARARADWQARAAAVRDAHARASTPPHVRPAAMPRGSTAHHIGWVGREDCDGHDCFAVCSEEGCADGLAGSVLGLLQGCHEFLAWAPHRLELSAHVIGAPDIGTVVESVSLDGEGEVPEALRECITEAMYALDLPAADEAFEQDVRMALGTGEIDVEAFLQSDHLDEATRTKIRDAIGDRPLSEGKVRVMHLGTPEIEPSAP